MIWEGTIGERIDFVLEYKELTKKDFAILVGKDPGYITRIISGEIENFKIDFLRLVCEKLECRADFILGLSDDFEQHSYADAICQYLNPLKPDQQEHCMLIIETNANAFIKQNVTKNVRPVVRPPYDKFFQLGSKRSVR